MGARTSNFEIVLIQLCYERHFVTTTDLVEQLNSFNLKASNRLSRPPPKYFNTVRSNAALLLWFLTGTCSCCPYLYFGSAFMLVTYFSKF